MNDERYDAALSVMTMDELAQLNGGSDGELAKDIVYGVGLFTAMAHRALRYFNAWGAANPIDFMQMQ